MSSEQYIADSSHALNKSPAELNIWMITDGRPGHRSQLEGLAKALKELTEIDLKWLDANNLSHLRRKQFRKKNKDQHKENSPDILIGAGHSTHRHVLNLANLYQAMSCILMSPSLPRLLFDCIICPEHDQAKPRDNTFITQGVLNKIPSRSPRAHDSSNKASILLGGPSKHFIWDQTGLVNQVETLVRHYPEKQWSVFNSIRSPNTLDTLVSNLCKQYSNAAFYSHKNKQAPSVVESLSLSSATWVSPDSASMIYESLTAGCATGIFSLQASSRRRPSKLAKSVFQLAESGWINTFERWSNTKTFEPAPGQLNESIRAGNWLLEQFNRWQSEQSNKNDHQEA